MVPLWIILQKVLEEEASLNSNSLTIAKGEAEELKSQLYRGLDNNYISKTLFEDLYHETELLLKKIGSFISYLNKSNIKGQKFKERL